MISRRADSETVSTSAGAAARPSREQPPAQPFLPAKPFRMRGKRDVVHEHDRRRVRAAAAPYSRERKTRPADPASSPCGSASCSHAVPAAAGDDRSSALAKRSRRRAHARRARTCGATRRHPSTTREAAPTGDGRRRWVFRRARGRQCRCAFRLWTLDRAPARTGVRCRRASCASS